MIPMRTMLGSGSICCALAASIFLIAYKPVEANTTTAAGLDLASVNAAVTLAHDGDTVILPSGTVHWASALTITKGITLQGSTTVDTSTHLGTANDQTTIIDDNTTGGDPNQVLRVTLGSTNQFFRLTGITF